MSFFGGGVASGGANPAGSLSTGFSMPATATGGMGGFGTQAPAAQSGFSFGTPAMSMPGAAPAPVATNTAFGMPGGVAPATSAAPGVAPGQFGGLGGTQGGTGALGFGGGFAVGKSTEARDWKELPVPPEVLQLVEELRNHIKSQKVKITELARASDKNIDKLSEEIEEIRLSLLNLTNQVCRQNLICMALIKEVAEEMRNADMAMVTRETPLALQGDITDPTNYFYRLVNSYTERMTNYKREIERCETALHSVVESGSAKDLPAAMKVTRNTVVSLAAKAQELHEQVYDELITHKNLKRFSSGGMGGRDIFVSNSSMSHGHAGGNARANEASHNIGGGDRMSSRVFGQEHATRGSSGMDPVIPPFVNMHYNQSYDRVNSLFSSPSQRESRSFFRSSTPLRHRGEFQSPQPLFNTASSTILGNQSSLGHGLKRAKDK